MGVRRTLGSTAPLRRAARSVRAFPRSNDPVAALRSELPKHSGGTAADSDGLPFSPVSGT